MQDKKNVILHCAAAQPQDADGASMALTAEIKTDHRRMIDYLLSPIRRYGHESLRER